MCSFVQITLAERAWFVATPIFSLRENAIAKEPGSGYPEGGRVCLGSALHWWLRLLRVFPVCNPEPGSVIGPITGDPDPRILPAIAWFPLVTLTCD